MSIRPEREHVAGVERLAAMMGVSKSAILAAAVTAYLSAQSPPWEAVSARRFARLARQLEHLNQGQTLLIETFAFFVRDYLADTAPAPEQHRRAARARERARFAQFIERLAFHLQRDGSLAEEPEYEVATDTRCFAPLGEESAIRRKSATRRECSANANHP